VIFRPLKDPTTSPAIVVLLVGETPTWGLQERQFEKALSIVDQARAWWPLENGGDEYRISGPTFSGTAASLSAAISKHRSPPTRHYKVVSGTATKTDVKETLEAARPAAPDGGTIVSYMRVTPSDEALLDAMLQFLDLRGGHGGDKHGRGANIALLTESLTTYGSGADETQPYIELKYPASLAVTPDSYLDGTVTSDAGGGGTTPLEGASLSRDQPATELSKGTAITHDLALGAVLRDLSARNVRFIGIVATNALDVVLLAQRIRSQLPDVRLFTLSTDIRYLDPRYASFLNGMLVAHSLPSPVGNHRPTSLQDEFVGSTFDAARALLARPEVPSLVRISLIGNGAFWQIDTDRRDGKPAYRETIAGWGKTPRAPVSWSFIFAFLLLVVVVISLLVLAPWLGDRVARQNPGMGERIRFLRHRGPLWALVEPCEHADLQTEDTAVTAAMLTVAASPPLLMFIAQFARDGDRANLAMTILSCGLVALVFGANAAFQWANRRRHDRWTRSAAWLTRSATLASFVALGLGCGAQRAATFNLMSGGSPVLPGIIGLSILGLGLWCWRIRLRFLDVHSFGVAPKTLFGEMDPPISQALGERLGNTGQTGLAEVEQALLRAVRNPWASVPLVPGAVHILLAICVIILFGIKPPQTFEPSWRNGLVVGFACLTLLPISGNFARLIATWIAFRRLLQRLAHSHVFSAMASLPSALTRPLAAQLQLSGSDIGDLVWPVQALEALATADGSFALDAKACTAIFHNELRCEAGASSGRDALEGSARRAELMTRLLAASERAAAKRAESSSDVRTLADSLAATLVAVFIPRYVRHFPLVVPPLVLGSVLGVLMISLYFVEPQRLIASAIFVWVAVTVLVIFAVYVALDRDPVISAIGKTTSGAVTWNWALARRVVAWGLFPLASLFAAQYSQFAYWISTLLSVVAKGFG
jgi:hypothetical protein